MAYTAWPDTVVNMTVLEESYGIEIAPNVIRSESDTGPAKFRRRSKLNIKRHTITLRLDRIHEVGTTGLTEFQHFDYFVMETLYSGVMNTTFVFPPETLARVCRFYTSGQRVQPYKISRYYGDYVFVNFTLEEVP